jgi:hypothetical protein
MKQLDYLSYFLKTFPQSIIGSTVGGVIIKLLSLIWIPFLAIYMHFLLVFLLICANMWLGWKAAKKQGELFNFKKFMSGFYEHGFADFSMLIIFWILEVIVKLSFPYDKFYVVGIITIFISLYEAGMSVKSAKVIWPQYSWLDKLDGILNSWQKKVEDTAKDLPDHILHKIDNHEIQ